MPCPHIQLVYEGAELFDGASVADFYIQQLSTIRAVWTPAEGAAGAVPAGRASTPSSAAAAAAATAAAQFEGSVLADGEVARAIVLRGIPSAEPAATEVSWESCVCIANVMCECCVRGYECVHSECPHCTLTYLHPSPPPILSHPTHDTL